MKAIFAFLCCIPILSISQEPFQRITFGPYMFSCDGADVGVNGGYIFCKNTLVKTDEMGVVEWAYLYNTNAHFHQVKKTYDNCYIATGELLVLGGIKEIMTIKVNEQGEVIWYNLYGGNNNDDERSYSICETSDSNYIIAGYTSTYGYGSSDIYLLRIDRFGNLRWARTSHGGQTGITNLDNWEISVAIDSMLCLPVSVQENFTMNFAIFPNPAMDMVSLIS